VRRGKDASPRCRFFSCFALHCMCFFILHGIAHLEWGWPIHLLTHTSTHHVARFIFPLTLRFSPLKRSHGQRGADVETLRGTSGANYEGEAKVNRGGKNSGFCGCLGGNSDGEPVSFESNLQIGRIYLLTCVGMANGSLPIFCSLPHSPTHLLQLFHFY